MLRNQLIVLSILVLLQGCASTSSPQSDINKSVQSPERTGVDMTTGNNTPAETGTDAAQPDEQTKVITIASYDATSNQVKRIPSTHASRQAVLDLLAQSKQAVDQYDYDEAENILNRALRIEPGNAWLWYNMAVVSFYQASYHQAIQQALKSNNLQRDNPKLRNNNYKIIRQSYIELGEPDKAQSMYEKIE